MERAWHQFAPAVPDQKIIDCAVAGFVANGLFIRRLDVVDVQQLPAPAALAKRASKAFSSAKVIFWRLRPPLGLDLSAASPPPS